MNMNTILKAYLVKFPNARLRDFSEYFRVNKLTILKG